MENKIEQVNNYQAKPDDLEKVNWQERINKYFRGEMHTHSVLSDEYNREAGLDNKEKAHRIERVLDFYAKQGLEFAVITEHGSDPGNPRQLKADDHICRLLLEQAEELAARKETSEKGIEAYSSVEASIFFDQDGQAVLDLPPEVLGKMDVVIASRHVIDRQRESEAIKASFLTAINNPDVDIIGHPNRHIEFYPHDWAYFKKYWREDKDLSGALEKMETEKDWDSIKKIIGKKDVEDSDDNFIQDSREKFISLESDYWRMWEEVLGAMEKKGKVFEINLNSFVPSKNFYQLLLAQAARLPNLKFSVSYDFHNLGQLKNIKDKDLQSEEIVGVKSPERNKAYRLLLDLCDLLEANQIGPDRIINSSKENFIKFLNNKKKSRLR
ncbi:hypothetical protein DRH27_04785 [Candidatus Falkowbacteria bacterium]|nr:MAG: hypothetical protein DRH27_04785 [Candidatus Falkowbacteria bacterium]